MSDLRTDEEQVEALKRWWEDNGKQLVGAVVLVVGGWLGFDAYQSNQQATAANAQLQYQQLLQLRQQEAPTDEQKAQAQLLASELKKQYEGTPYASYAALLLAKDSVEDRQLDQAEAELRFALGKTQEPALEGLITARLARVLSAQGATDEALALVEKLPEGPFSALFLEIKGDILSQKGQFIDAKQAYDQALASSSTSSSNAYLEMKANDLYGLTDDEQLSSVTSEKAESADEASEIVVSSESGLSEE